MQLSITSIFSMFIFSLLFSIVLAIILENIQLLKRVKCEVILICLAVPVFKMLIPLEIMPWTINVNVHGRFAEVIWWLNKKIYIWGDYRFSRWEIFTGAVLTLSLLNVLRELVLYWFYLHNVHKLPELEDVKFRQMVDSIMKEYGKDISIPIKRTRLVTAPSILGMKKVIILFPEMKLDDLNVEGVIRHEIAHYMHGDIHIKFIWSIVKALNFWNPVVYILDRQLVKVLEIRADEKAVEKMTHGERHEYRSALAIISNRAGKKKNNKFCIAFLNRKGLLVRKRIDLLEVKYERTHGDIIANYLCMVICAVGMFVLMNCFILEPISEIPKVENFEGTKMVTEDSCFLVKNKSGTYDMYMDGIYCATIEDDLGSGLPIYESLEEALKYEENK